MSLAADSDLMSSVYFYVLHDSTHRRRTGSRKIGGHGEIEAISRPEPTRADPSTPTPTPRPPHLSRPTPIRDHHQHEFRTRILKTFAALSLHASSIQTTQNPITYHRLQHERRSSGERGERTGSPCSSCKKSTSHVPGRPPGPVVSSSVRQS